MLCVSTNTGGGAIYLTSNPLVFFFFFFFVVFELLRKFFFVLFLYLYVLLNRKSRNVILRLILVKMAMIYILEGVTIRQAQFLIRIQLVK
jgi:hypothetical protein